MRGRRADQHPSGALAKVVRERGRPAGVEVEVNAGLLERGDQLAAAGVDHPVQEAEGRAAHVEEAGPDRDQVARSRGARAKRRRNSKVEKPRRRSRMYAGVMPRNAMA